MNAAVFVDFENLYLSLKSRNDGTGVRTRELSLQILEGMLARLREKGHSMVIGRSYAAFDTFPGVEVAHDLALSGLDPQYVLISHTGKNSADVQLALDVARVVFQRKDIEMIVIVSGDRDFIPLARQVLEEGRELRIVAIPDTTSGDLLERVGEHRFVNALDLIRSPVTLSEPVPVNAEQLRQPAADAHGKTAPDGELSGSMLRPSGSESPSGGTAQPVSARSELQPEALAGVAVTEDPQESEPSNVVGHVPVTWQVQRTATPEEHEDRLRECLEMLAKTRLRHNSPDIWLSPFLKGPMSQHFSSMVHPERRALINELRSRGVIHIEERENAYADHPYSVIVIVEDHPMAQAAWDRASRGR